MMIDDLNLTTSLRVQAAKGQRLLCTISCGAEKTVKVAPVALAEQKGSLCWRLKLEQRRRIQGRFLVVWDDMRLLEKREQNIVSRLRLTRICG